MNDLTMECFQRHYRQGPATDRHHFINGYYWTPLSPGSLEMLMDDLAADYEKSLQEERDRVSALQDQIDTLDLEKGELLEENAKLQAQLEDAKAV